MAGAWKKHCPYQLFHHMTSDDAHMEVQMTEFVKKEDLHIINRALNNGSDVKIQLTKDGYRITEDTMKVLKRVAIRQEKMEK